MTEDNVINFDPAKNPHVAARKEAKLQALKAAFKESRTGALKATASRKKRRKGKGKKKRK